MIPLSDSDRRPVRYPIVTTFIIGANVIMFLIELGGGKSFIDTWAMKPAELMSGRGYITVLTAMFMHAGIIHILGNMVFLWAFGPEMEDAMGRGRFMVFYLLGGVVATAAQVAASPASTVPNLGASGAIAAVMGAFLVTYPRDRIRTIIFLGWFITISLIPAIFLVGFWFLIQLLSEIGAIIERQAGGIAYMAHIGGLLFGMAVAKLFSHRRGE